MVKHPCENERFLQIIGYEYIIIKKTLEKGRKMSANVDLIQILLNWKLVLIVIVVIVVLPIIFYFASLDKKAVKVKKIRYKSDKGETPTEPGQQSTPEETKEGKRRSSSDEERSVRFKEER
jgi:hypothetical protein